MSSPGVVVHVPRRHRVGSVEELLDQVGPTFFGVTFTKIDGTEITRTGRMGVTRYLSKSNPVGSWTFEQRKSAGYITYYDITVGGYRVLKPENVVSLRVFGKSFVFDN